MASTSIYRNTQNQPASIVIDADVIDDDEVFDTELIRKGLEDAIPFNVHNGIEVVSIEGNCCTARLPDEPHLKNHVGTQHGGALFAVAETAAGGAFVAVIGDRITQLRLVARGAQIRYSRFARGAVIAESEFVEPIDKVIEAAKSGTDIEVPAVIRDEATGDTLAHMSFTFQIKEVA